MADTPEMVERVAMACAAARFGTTVDALYWSQQSESWKQAHIDIALTAIAAMREPTNEMIDNATRLYAGAFNKRLAESIWSAMIYAAIKD